MLGGSSTFGLYVGQNAAFPAVLQRQLQAQVRDRQVEVINLGCAGWASSRVANEPWIDLRPTFQGDLSLAWAQKLFIDHRHPTPMATN